MHTLWKIISNFFKWSWSLLNFIRECVFNVFLLVLIISAIGIYLQVCNTPPVLTKGALIIDLAGTVVDKPSTHNKFRQFSRELFGASNNKMQENSLFDLVNTLRHAKNEINITGIVLLLKDFSGTDQVSLQYIGKALKEFRNSGKPIYAIGDSYSQEQYFLASYANKIYLTPYGVVDLHGIATNNLYYNTLLNKMKINSHVFRVGTHKSAVEPFLRDNMSDAVRQDNNRWVNQLWQHYLDTVATNRKITPQQLFPGAQIMLSELRKVNGNTAQFALNNKWVDEIASYSTIETEMTKIFGWNKRSKSFNAISIYDYQPIPTQQGEQIAVIIMNGIISDNSETPGLICSYTTADQIRDARLNSNIKAIVFRVNSPGGSVNASEVIRSELAAVRTIGKPIVVSMGKVAASGGYWVSTPADYIIASASTITGSIGIFGIINTVESLLDNIGVHTDGVTTSPLADVSITKTLPTEFSQMMQINVENGYHNFISLVAQSRHKTLEEIDKIAQGHVWIGSDAVQNGLVDQLGDFDDAVSKAAELAKLKKYQLSWYAEKPKLINLLLAQASTWGYAIIPNLIQSWFSMPFNQIANKLKTDVSMNFKWNDPRNSYAYCISCGQVQQ